MKSIDNKKAPESWRSRSFNVVNKEILTMNIVAEKIDLQHTLANDQILDVVEVDIGGSKQFAVDARSLHAFLEVGRDFTNWIKGRITKYGFTLDSDYVVVENLSSPILASSKSRQQKQIDYLLILDMAKELSMVENNEKGRQARRYFIRCEKLAFDAMKEKFMGNAIESRQVISPEQKDSLQKIVDGKVKGNHSLRAQIWARHNRHFKINSYHELLAIHFHDSIQYLLDMEVKGKTDGDQLLDKFDDFIQNIASRYPTLQNPIAHEIAEKIAEKMQYQNTNDERLVYYVTVNKGKVCVMPQSVHHCSLNVVKLAEAVEPLLEFITGYEVRQRANQLRKLTLKTLPM